MAFRPSLFIRNQILYFKTSPAIRRLENAPQRDRKDFVPLNKLSQSRPFGGHAFDLGGIIFVKVWAQLAMNAFPADQPGPSLRGGVYRQGLARMDIDTFKSRRFVHHIRFVFRV